MFEDMTKIREHIPEALEELQGDVSPWYEKMGQPIVMSSILAPNKLSILDNLEFALQRWRTTPEHRQLRLTDIDAFRRMNMDESIAHLACVDDGSFQLTHFEQHFGYQFYWNIGNPRHYIGIVGMPPNNDQH